VGSISSELLALLRCPITGAALRLTDGSLSTVDGSRQYPVTASGIPLFGDAWLSADGRTQREHYDQLAPKYLTNLTYPHTQEYMAFLDRALFAALPESLGTVAELCCGAGEGLQLIGRRAQRAVGVDVSTMMLEAAQREPAAVPRLLVQGDATRLPLQGGAFDTVLMLGGIHHVNDRAALFAEVARLLRPGGLFVFREPVDDFFVWRAIRSVVYRAASSLEAGTEHPLRFQPTASAIERAGMTLDSWRTYGFLAYCVLMNSDVLPINRLWQYVPGIRPLTRAAARLDDVTLRVRGLQRAGLIAIGTASKQ